MTEDLTTIGADAGTGSSSGDLSAIGSDCQTLLDDLGVLQGDVVPTTLAPSMQTGLTSAESDLTKGANQCIQGATNNDPSSISAASRLFGSAGTVITQVSNQLG